MSALAAVAEEGEELAGFLKDTKYKSMLAVVLTVVGNQEPEQMALQS
jgi:hypothetical protein